MIYGIFYRHELDPSWQFFFALVTLLRFPLNIGLLERPAALGLLWGFLTGHWELGLGLGLFYELLWLDLFHAGTYIPPNAPASTLAALCLAEIWYLMEPGSVLLPLIVCIPLGLIGSRLEYFQRRWQTVAYNKLLQWARQSHHPENQDDRQLQSLMIRSLIQNAILNFLFFATTTSLLWFILTWLRVPSSFLNISVKIGWGHMWFCAMLGGVLSLKVKRAYTTLALGVLTAAMLGATAGW